MVLFDSRNVERKVVAILQLLSEARSPLGARLLARQLEAQGVALGERAVRYHLRLMDMQGLTRNVGRDGRVITHGGEEELRNALVSDKMGFVISRIESLAYATTFDAASGQGRLPVNFALYQADRLEAALQAMRLPFEMGICAGGLAAVVEGGQGREGMWAPPDKVGLVTLSNVLVNGVLLKAGIPVHSRFGGLLEMRQGQPRRFVELISYDGSTVDPSELFIRGRMTSVRQACLQGQGKVLADFREIPAQCRASAAAVFDGLRGVLGRVGVVAMGGPGEAVCQVGVGAERVGMVLMGGLNPVAAAEEAGIPSESQAMRGTLDVSAMVPFGELAREKPPVPAL